MSNSGAVILGDLGGTHLRLGRQSANGPEDVRVYKLQEWASLSEALKDYGGTAGAKLLLSFAKKYNAQGVYKLDQAHKGAAWSFSIDDLKNDLGLADAVVVHDFRAMALALFHTAPDVFLPVAKGVPTDRLRVIIGVGTGVGHALADPVSGAIYDTFGGHFPPCAVTAEQKSILAQLEDNFPEKRTFIFEEILSGRGLQAIYAMLGGAGDIALADGKIAQETCRLFSEFLGLYANTVCVGAHAFGGLYLCGGVIEKLYATGRFNEEAFFRNFRLNMVPIVDEALVATPVFRASAAHTALYGLEVYAARAIA